MYIQNIQKYIRWINTKLRLYILNLCFIYRLYIDYAWLKCEIYYFSLHYPHFDISFEELEISNNFRSRVLKYRIQAITNTQSLNICYYILKFLFILLFSNIFIILSNTQVFRYLIDLFPSPPYFNVGKIPICARFPFINRYYSTNIY